MKTTLYDERVSDLIEEYFPKGKSKERGNALVLVARMKMLQRKGGFWKMLKAILQLQFVITLVIGFFVGIIKTIMWIF